MITPIDVIDSAVKIGLGALISGLATYWLAKVNYDKTIQKERAQRKRELLEGIAQEVASFDQVALRYWQKTINWILYTPETEPMSAEFRTHLISMGDQFSDAFKDLRSAEAKLLLLGEGECQTLIRGYWDCVEFYNVDQVASRAYKVDALELYKKELQKKRDEFFRALSAVYTSV